ncbi:unnamed protein product [Calypogeia fissa]
MVGKHHASASSAPTASPIGSGALSHAFIQYPPLWFNPSGAAGLFYDDGNQLLLVPSPDKVLSWPVNQKIPPDDPSETKILEGPLLFVRFSLDGSILAVQRSGQEVEFVGRETGVLFRQRCRHATDQILGLFWTDCPTCDVVFVTSSGLELYTVNHDRTGMKYIEAKRLNVSWYGYTHESRLVLLASGMQCKTLACYQFSAGGIIKLPKFDVSMEKAEDNSRPVLCSHDIHIATMYGRIYCLQVDRIAMELRVYRFYRDAVEPQGFLPIYSRHVALSVVDNVLLVHEIDSKVVLLYDVMSDSKVPISAPLPLLLRGLPSNPLSRTTSERESSSFELEQLEKSTLAEATVYDSGWVFANPNIVLDRARALLWKIHLDLEAIAASSSDILLLLAFLQRRSLEANKAKLLSVEIVRSMIIERQPLPLIGRAMDILACSYAQAVKLNTSHRSPGKKCIQESNTPASRISAMVQAPRDFDVSGATLPDSIVQGVQQTPTKRESSAVYVEVEASSTGRVQGSLDQNDGNSLNSSPKAAQITTNSAGDTSNVASRSLIENLNDGSTGTSSHDHSSALGEISGRPLEQPHAEMYVTEVTESKGTTPSISPEEMQKNVFSAIERDMIVDSPFLVATIIEYLHSSTTEHVRVNPGLHVLIIQLLAQQQQYYELWQLIVGKVVPPSKTVAFQLLEVGTQDIATRKLGMDMLRQLHGHTDYVTHLLREGRILEAICHVRQTKVEGVAPAVFLEAANALKDPQILACVFRFCLESVPNFRQTSDFSAYLSTLRYHSSIPEDGPSDM